MKGFLKLKMVLEFMIQCCYEFNSKVDRVYVVELLISLARIINPKLQNNQLCETGLMAYVVKFFNNYIITLDEFGNKWFPSLVSG